MLAACTYAAVAQNAGTPANNKTFFVAKPGTLVSMLTEDEAKQRHPSYIDRKTKCH